MIKLLPILRYLTLIVLFLACVQLVNHRWENYLSLAEPIKDEILFVTKYDFSLKNGWYESIVAGTSPVYNATIFIFDSVIDDPFISMKLVNIFSMLGIIGIWIYYLLVDLKVSSRYRWLSVFSLIYLTVVYNAFFSACNDSLFLLFISLGFYSFLKVINRFRLSTFLFTAFWFGLALGTRELLVFYVPGILLSIVLLFTYKSIKTLDLLAFLSVIGLVTILVYFPSIYEKGKLSFLDKNEEIYEGYWQEKNYLQLMLNINKLERVDVESYKENNPDIILPKSYISGIFMDPVLTLKNSVRQFKLINSAIIWKIGLVYFLFLGFVIRSIQKKEFLRPEFLIFMIFILYAAAFAILPINRVEFRWFILFPILFYVLTIYRIDLSGSRFSWLEYLVYFNFLIIGLVNFFLIGIW